MDNQKIYNNLIILAKTKNRIKNKMNYYESHHIVPDFMFVDRKRKGPKGHLPGNPNSMGNKVLLTVKEHFIAHVLLWKILKKTRYEYAAGSALQFFFTKVIGEHPRSKNFIGAKKYEKYRLIGLDAISKSRTGHFPAKDAVTGISMGSVSVTDPRVKSGEWVHHSMGVKSNVKNRKTQSGSNNTNYKEIPEKLLMAIFAVSHSENVFSRKSFISQFNAGKEKRQSISEVYIKNHYISWANFVKVMNGLSGLTLSYCPYHRSLNQKAQLAIKSASFRWVNNGLTDKKISHVELAAYLTNNYTQGRMKKIND